MPATKKVEMYQSYPVMDVPTVTIDDKNILQLSPNIGQTGEREKYNYKGTEFVIPGCSALGGYIHGDNHWLVFVSNASLLDVCKIFVYQSGAVNKEEITKAEESYKQNLLGAILVNDIPAWKSLSKILFEHNVLVKHPKEKDLKTDISKTQADIDTASDILHVLITVALEIEKGNLLSSIPLVKEHAENANVKALTTTYKISEPTGLLGKYAQVFSALELLFSEEQIQTRQKQEIIDGQAFDSDEEEAVIFPYTGEFPSNIQVKFNPTEPKAYKKSGSNYGGSTSVNVEGYSATEGYKHFMRFMDDELLTTHLTSLTHSSKVLVCLSLSGVPALPQNLHEENVKYEKMNNSDSHLDENGNGVYMIKKKDDKEGKTDTDTDGNNDENDEGTEAEIKPQKLSRTKKA